MLPVEIHVFERYPAKGVLSAGCSVSAVLLDCSLVPQPETQSITVSAESIPQMILQYFI